MKFSFIGAGNMASAIINGICLKNLAAPSDICVSDKDDAKLADFAKKGIVTTQSNSDCADFGDVIIIAVKPNIVAKIAPEIKDEAKSKLVVSIAAGVSSDSLKKMIKSDRVVRIMPNTPALVGEGMTAVCKTDGTSDEDIQTVCKIFDSVGKTVVIPESQIDAVTAVSGSGPAYIYMVIEAMADGGVLCGLTREDAYALAAQTVLGSAKTVLETGIHPGKLKDAVCSPGGTTIEAVKVLEEKGLRSAFIDAVVACRDKSEKMSK